MRIVVIALLSVASNLTISHAQNLATMDEVHMQNEGKRSLVSLVQHVSKQERDQHSSKILASDTGSGNNPQERVQSYPFSDSITHRYASDIATLYRLGVVKGCQKDRFCPDNILKRYEVLSMLVSVISVTKPSSLQRVAIPFDTGAYADVRLTDSYADIVYQAKALGLLDALEVKQQGKFFLYPNAAVTDQEMLMLIRQVLGYAHQPSDQTPLPITKAQGAFLLVQAFDLGEISQPLTNKAVDIPSQPPVESGTLPDATTVVPRDTFTYRLISNLQYRFS